MTPTQTALQTYFSAWPWQWDKALAEYTYFKIGGTAEAYLELSDPQQVIELLKFCQGQSIPWRILGGASNVIVSDQQLLGVTLHLNNEDISVLEPSATGDLRLQAGAGVKTALLVSESVKQGMTGLEYFLGVPGTLGGAIYNNSHYLSHLIGTYIESVQVITKDLQLTWLPAAECDFKYDHSRFQSSGEVIVAAIFKLQPGNYEQSQALIKEATVYRATTQPLGEPSSGCIFQNAPNTPELRAKFPQFAHQEFVPGGFLIDQAGLKGTRIGGVEVSHKHAAFFINRGGATIADVQALLTKVKTTVREKFGVELNEEVFFVK